MLDELPESIAAYITGPCVILPALPRYDPIIMPIPCSTVRYRTPAVPSCTCCTIPIRYAAILHLILPLTAQNRAPRHTARLFLAFLNGDIISVRELLYLPGRYLKAPIALRTKLSQPLLLPIAQQIIEYFGCPRIPSDNPNLSMGYGRG